MNNYKKKLINKCLALFISLCLASCASMGKRQGASCDLKLIRSFTKTQIGTGVGTAIGAGAGAAIGGDKHRLEGALIGAAVGALLGAGVGYILDAREECDLQAKMIETLNTAHINQPVHWQSNRSNASAEMTVISESEETRQVSIPFEPASGLLVASTSLHVRSGPDITYDILKTLKPHSKVTVLGITENGWYRIEKNGVVGYAKKDHLRSEESTVTTYKSPEVHQIRPDKTTSRKRNTSTVNKDSGQAILTSTEDKVIQKNKTSEELKLNMKVICKTVRIRTSKGEELTGKSCQTPDGSWGA